ncbi:hypothetical protein P5663_19410 [Priestia flexa]|uniref:hypothetical protein n=1 Tax=Priestia flexa TaxID=86664 RepID=UPI00240CF542|nr:hypothetical protein [Priestia flexa]WEZ08160.1 hypothetical protein P5663_19410 [Priestia flexa]
MADFVEQLEKFFEEQIIGSHEKKMDEVEKLSHQFEKHERQLQKQEKQIDDLYNDDPFGQ